MPQTSGPQDSDSHLPARHPLAWGVLLIFAVVMSWATWTTEPLQSANDRSRWCTVWSLVERGTYRIDEIDHDTQWSTIDKVRHQSKGETEYHFYSSKPPLFPTMVAGLYWLQKHVLGMDLRQDTQVTAQSLLLFINVLPFCLALLAFEKSLRVLKLTPLAAAAVLAIAAFTSMLNPFLTTLNNHTPAAACLMFCLAALIRIESHQNKKQSEGSASASTLDFVIVGFTAALVCCFELPAALFGVLSFLAVVRHSIRKTLIAYAPAAIVPLAAFFATNIICTDGIKPFYTYYGTEKYEYVHEGVPSYWVNPKGIDANQESPAVYLFHCVLGHHGLLSVTPIFLLAIPGWWFLLRHRQPKGWKAVAVMGAFLSFAILSFYLTRTQNYNYGGNTSGLRWMLWLTPFWWYAIAPMVARLLKAGIGIIVLLVLSSVSAYSSADALGNAWKPNWIYRLAADYGWIDYSTTVPDFDPPRYSVIHPSMPLEEGMVYRFGGSDDAKGRAILIRVIDSGAPSSDDDAGIARWNIRLMRSQESVQRNVEILVNPLALTSGAKLDAAVREATLEPAKQPIDIETFLQQPEAPGWVVRLFQGLTTPKAFQAASERYLKYTNAEGEITAVRCDRGAARIQVRHPEHGFCWQRCDIFYCDEAPLGVARWSITLSSKETGKVIRRETWTCRDLP